MPLPLTNGVMRTDLASMEIGDYIPFNYDTTATGVVGSFSSLGSASGIEIPTIGIAVPNSANGDKAYFVKTKKGTLVADRNLQTSVSWDTLNAGRMIEGNNDPMMWKLGNPSTLPTGSGYTVAYSNDGKYMAIGHAITPFVTIYKRSGDTFTKLPNPDILPTGLVYGMAFSNDGKYLSVAHDISPFVTIYKITVGDVFTKLTNPNVLPIGMGNMTAFSPDGNYMSVAHTTAPYLTIYKITSGDVFTKLADPSTLPTGIAYGTAFSADNNYMSVAHRTTPFVTIYKRSGDTFTKLANPSSLPAGFGFGVTFSPNNKYMAVAGYYAPFLTIYKITNGDIFTRIYPDININGVTTATAFVVAFSPNNNYMTVTSDTAPFITTYKIASGDNFIKLTNIPMSQSSVGQGVAFSNDNNYLTFGSSTSPFVTNYKIQDNILIRSLSGGNSYADYPTKRIVSLLLHGDGADGSTTFTDSSPNPKVITRGGSAMIKTDQYKFGSSSMYFNAGTDGLTISANSDFNFDANDFTIECWLRPSSTNTMNIFKRDTFFCISTWGSNLQLQASSTSTGGDIANTVTIGSGLILNQWNHIVVCRRGSSIMGFVNGIMGTPITSTLALYSSLAYGLEIGKATTCYIEEVRIIKGEAEYTKAFTPPIAPYSEPTNARSGVPFSSTTDNTFGAFPQTNEWEQFIVNSNLNGQITKGDDNVWHWSNVSSWCKERPILAIGASTNRIERGGASVGATKTTSLSSAVLPTIGFRPMLHYVEDGGKATNLFY